MGHKEVPSLSFAWFDIRVQFLFYVREALSVCLLSSFLITCLCPPVCPYICNDRACVWDIRDIPRSNVERASEREV